MILVKLDYNYFLMFKTVPPGLLELLHDGVRVKSNGHGDTRTIEPVTDSVAIEIEIVPDRADFNGDLSKLLKDERDRNSKLSSENYQLKKAKEIIDSL